MKELLLRDYRPITRLRLEEHCPGRPKYPAIDGHAHFGRLGLGEHYEEAYDTGEAVAAYRELGIERAVNLDGESGPYLDRMLKKMEGYEDFFILFGNVEVERLDDAGFDGYVYRTLCESKRKGVRGLKFWKNLSLGILDQTGSYIPLNDRRLSPVWQYAAQLGMPVLLHVGDPEAFFSPVTPQNERYEELQAHPEWSFCREGLYSFEELMEQQEQMVADNPETVFIIAHFGSWAENLKEVARWMDTYPNFNVDIAERIAELGRQPYSSRRFFEKYSDRIIFGTDSMPGHMLQSINYRFLETEDEYFDYSYEGVPPQGRWKIYGLGLQDSVLEKIYSKNIQRILSWPCTTGQKVL